MKIGHEDVIRGALGLLGSLRTSGEGGTSSTDEAARLGRAALDLLVAERDTAQEELRKWETHIYPTTYADALARVKELDGVLRDLIAWAGKQTFENDAAWVNARAALHEMQHRRLV